MLTNRRNANSMSVWRARLELVALVVIIIVGLATLPLLIRRAEQPTQAVETVPRTGTRTPPPPPPLPVPTDPVSIAGTRVTGDPNASLVIIEFAEPECPFCARFYEGAYRELRAKYVETGKARFVYWHLPLEVIHRRALKAAEAAECAGDQGRFWEMHDLLLEDQDQLDEPSLHARAERLGLDRERFMGCLDNQMTDKVRRQAAEAERLMVRGTPTFFFRRVQADGTVRVVERFSGAQPIGRFDAVLTRLLAEAEPEAHRQ